MTSKLTSEEAARIFGDLERQTEDKDDLEISALLASLEANGVIISVESTTEEPIWDDSPGANFMEVVQKNRMLISGWPVYQWTTKFWGYWGGMGAGWWTEKGDSTLEVWLEELLEAGDLLPEDAEVPQPEFEDEDED